MTTEPTPPKRIADEQPVFPCELYYPGDKNTEAFWSPTLHEETWRLGMPGFTHWRPPAPSPAPESTPAAGPAGEAELRQAVRKSLVGSAAFYPDAVKLNEAIDHLLTVLSPLLARQTEELAKLTAWKESAMAVEASWDCQAVAKMLDMPLGVDIRAQIEPGIAALRAQLTAAESRLAEAGRDKGMIEPVMQTKKGLGGNCLAACLASIFRVSLDEIPDLAPREVFTDLTLQNKLMREWLAGLGLHYLEIDLTREGFTWTDGAVPNVPCLIAVKSGTPEVAAKGFGHFVVGTTEQDGDKVTINVLHDPNGMAKSYVATAIGFFVPVRPKHMEVIRVPRYVPATKPVRLIPGTTFDGAELHEPREDAARTDGGTP